MADYDYEYEDPYAPKVDYQYDQADDDYAKFLEQQQQQQYTVPETQTEYYEEVVEEHTVDEEHTTEEEITVDSGSVEEVTVDSEEVIEEEIIEEPAYQRQSDRQSIASPSAPAPPAPAAEQPPPPPPPLPPAVAPEPPLGVVHQYLKDGTWDALLEYLQHLKTREPSTILLELSETDTKKSTPYHITSWKAPYHVTKQLVNTLPSEFREEVLMKQDSEGNTPLHLACSKLRVNTADGMLDAGALRVFTKYAPRSQEVLNWAGDCPIHLLLTSPAFCDVGTSNPGEGEVPHAEMCEDVVMSILEKYPSLAQALNFAGSTILHIAAERGVHERVLLSLLDRLPASMAQIADKAGRLPLHSLAACIMGKPIVPITFASKLAEVFPPSLMMPCNSGDTPLHLMVSNVQRNKDVYYRKDPNTTKFAKLLLGSSTDPRECPLLVRNREKFYTPLHCSALFNASPEAIFILLSSPFAKQAFGMLDGENATPFHLACSSDSVGESTEVVEMFGTKDGGILQDKLGRTPLHVAAENPRSTKAIIKVLAEINPKAAKIETVDNLMPLHVAIRKRADESVVKSLIKMYPKAALVVFEGDNTVLHEACQYKLSSSSIKAILKEFPELARQQNKYGNLPLHVATAYQVDAEIVELLLAVHPEGAMTQNRNADVPLHYAASFPQSSESTIFLVDAAPAAACLENENGETPYDRAKESGLDRDVLKLMKRSAKQSGGHDSSGSLDALNRSKDKKSRKSVNDESMEFDIEGLKGRRERKAHRKEDESGGSFHLSDLKHSAHSTATPNSTRRKRHKDKKRSKDREDDPSDESDSEEEERKKSSKKASKATGKVALKAATLAVMSAQKSKKSSKLLAASDDSSRESEDDEKKKYSKKASRATGKGALKAAALAVMSAQKSKKSSKLLAASDDSSDESEEEDEKKRNSKKASKATLKAAALAVISAQKASKKAQKQLAASMSILQSEQERAKGSKSKKLSLAEVATDVMEKNGKTKKEPKKRESKRFAESSATLDTEVSSKSKKSWKKLQGAVLRDAKPDKEVASTNSSKSKKNWSKLRESVSSSRHRKDRSVSKERVRSRQSPGRSKSSDMVSPGGRSRRRSLRNSKSPAPGRPRASVSLPMPVPPLTPSSKKDTRGSVMLSDMLSEPPLTPSSKKTMLSSDQRPPPSSTRFLKIDR